MFYIDILTGEIKMFYHGTSVGGLEILMPAKSNQGKFIYFSDNKLNIFPYLANPCQVVLDKKYGKGVKHIHYRIAQYSFTPEGKLVLVDIWPNYLKDTFKGQTGYIYYFKNIDGIKKLEGMDNIYGLDRPIEVENVEVIPDIYEEIVKLNKEGLVELVFYEDMKQEKRDMFSKRFLETYKKTENPLVKEVLFDKFKMIQDYENSLKEKL